MSMWGAALATVISTGVMAILQSTQYTMNNETNEKLCVCLRRLTVRIAGAPILDALDK